MSGRREQMDVIRAAVERGWTVERTKRHIVLMHPDGGKVFCSATPHDSNAHRRLAHDLRKVEQRGYVKRPVTR